MPHQQPQRTWQHTIQQRSQWPYACWTNPQEISRTQSKQTVTQVTETTRVAQYRSHVATSTGKTENKRHLYSAIYMDCPKRFSAGLADAGLRDSDQARTTTDFTEEIRVDRLSTRSPNAISRQTELVAAAFFPDRYLFSPTVRSPTE